RIPSVEIGVKTTWNEIVNAELRSLDGRLVPSMRMRSLMATLYRPAPGGRPNPLQAAKAIYRFVCDNIDPAPAGESAAHIHMDRMGDRNLLLLSMLRAAGLDAHPAAVRPAMDFMHPPAWKLPKRDVFPVSLVRLNLPGGGSHWLDTRFDSLPFGKVTDDLSGATAITFMPDGPLFETLPTLPAEESMMIRDKTIRLPGDGGPLEVSGRSLRRGVAGLLRDQQLTEADAESRRNILLGALYPAFPDAALLSFEVQHTDENEASSLERYEATSRAPIEDRGGGVRAVSLCLQSPGAISSETRNLKTRRTACHIKSVQMAEDRNVFHLPENARFVSLPKPAHIPSRFGVYQLRVNRRGDDAVEIIRNYHIPAQRISPWIWPGFLDFLDQVDLAEKQWIEYAVEE
ncbi:MAG: transglutaminase-like domain-containing protein, partial [Planctomycetota bacterium]|nr:transglutaminase-like domain-containing protein [Planctomycetota bacterium]